MVVLCDDSRFYRGNAFRIGDDAFISDVRATEAFLQSAPGSSLPETPNASTRAPSAAMFAATFPAPPRHSLCSTKSTTGTAASRRQSRRRAPQVAVQHQVAKHADTLAAKARINRFQPGNSVGNVGGHVLSSVFCHLIVYSSAIFASSGSMTGISSRTG